MYGTYCRLGVHVFASNLAVLRAFHTKLNSTFIRDRDARDRRHNYYREILRIHSNEQNLVRQFRL